MNANFISKGIFLILTLSVIAMSYLLYNKSKLCESCKHREVDTIELPGNSDLSLKIDLKDRKNFQPFSYDIVNSYSILGRITANQNTKTIESIVFGTIEAGKCKRFKIESVTHKKVVLNGEEVHWFTLKINNTGNKGGNKLKFTEPINYEKGNIIYTQVISDNDKRIETRLQTGSNPEEYEIFPPYICQGKIM